LDRTSAPSVSQSIELISRIRRSLALPGFPAEQIIGVTKQHLRPFVSAWRPASDCCFPESNRRAAAMSHLPVSSSLSSRLLHRDSGNRSRSVIPGEGVQVIMAVTREAQLAFLHGGRLPGQSLRPSLEARHHATFCFQIWLPESTMPASLAT
jgi:hypothetical protein